MTPSKSTKMCLPTIESRRVKCFRYHPTPAGRKAPAPSVGFFSSNGPAMLQSCDTSSFRQIESSKFGFSAPLASDFKKRQSSSKLSVVLTDFSTGELAFEQTAVVTKSGAAKRTKTTRMAAKYTHRSLADLAPALGEVKQIIDRSFKIETGNRFSVM